MTASTASTSITGREVRTAAVAAAAREAGASGTRGISAAANAGSKSIATRILCDDGVPVYEVGAGTEGEPVAKQLFQERAPRVASEMVSHPITMSSLALLLAVSPRVDMCAVPQPCRRT